MEYAKKMALVDPRLLENVRAKAPSNMPIASVLRDLDDEMRNILQRTDMDVREKVALYNQVLGRYNDLDDRRRQVPLRVAITKTSGEEKEAALDKPDDEATTSPNRVPLESKIIDSVPKIMRKKARRLLDKIRTGSGVEWNDRGQLLINNTVVPGSNVVDLVNDVLRKRRHFERVGWQPFVRGLGEMNVPMDLVGNPEWWRYMQSAGVNDGDIYGPTVEATKRVGTRRRRRWSSAALTSLRWDPY